MTPQHIINQTRAWVERAVVGLNLCPFAKAPLVKNQIRFVVCESDHPNVLMKTLSAQMQQLVWADAQTLETTLIIHPHVLQDFADFVDFLAAAEAELIDSGHSGTLQIASFHPHYQFEGTELHDLSNATNQSPYPTLHVLRENSVERAVAAMPNPQTIVQANINTLQTLGEDGWQRLLQQCQSSS
jgi:uncharacterized protein